MSLPNCESCLSLSRQNGELRRAYDEMSKRSCEKTVYIAECEDAIDGLRAQLDNEKRWNATLEITARKDAEQARNAALEEAAKVAEDFYPNQTYGIPIAFAIRALKEETDG